MRYKLKLMFKISSYHLLLFLLIINNNTSSSADCLDKTNRGHFSVLSDSCSVSLVVVATDWRLGKFFFYVTKTYNSDVTQLTERKRGALVTRHGSECTSASFALQRSQRFSYLWRTETTRCAAWEINVVNLKRFKRPMSDLRGVMKNDAQISRIAPAEKLANTNAASALRLAIGRVWSGYENQSATTKRTVKVITLNFSKEYTFHKRET